MKIERICCDPKNGKDCKTCTWGYKNFWVVLKEIVNNNFAKRQVRESQNLNGSVVSSKSPPDPSRFHRFTGSPPGSCVVLHARQRGPSTPGTSSGWVSSQSFQWFWWLKIENKLDPRCQNRSRVAKIVMWYFESIYSFLRKPRGPLWWSHSNLSKELGIDPQNLNSSLCNHREGPNHLLSQTHHAMQAVWPRGTRSSCTCNTRITRITFFHATINIAQNPKVM